MSKIAIVTDVNAGLDYIEEKLDIPTLRSIINFGDEHYVDGIDIKADKFYEKLQTSPIVPSTSAPTVGEAMDLLDRLVSEEYTDCIMYSISYNLSSIGQMFETLIPEYKNKINIYVMNTNTATYLQGYPAVVAKHMVDEGCSVDEILKETQRLIDSCHAYFVVDDLKYLVKNGRLSNAAGFLGGLLRIKPVLEMTDDGKIVSIEKVKTHRKAVERALDKFKERIKDKKKVFAIVLHTCREDDAKNIQKHLLETCPNIVKSEIHMVTPAVGAHIGCGIIGFGYFVLD